MKRACAQTPGEFKAAVRKAVAKYDTRQVEQRHQDAFARRRVEHIPEDDGMATVVAVLGADGARR